MTSDAKAVRCTGCQRRQEKLQKAAIAVWRKVQTLKKGKRK